MIEFNLFYKNVIFWFRVTSQRVDRTSTDLYKN
jgi:hypothetical protein